LLLQRSWDQEHYPGLWSHPGGKVEPNENHLKAIVRETEEETGIHTVPERWTYLGYSDFTVNHTGFVHGYSFSHFLFDTEADLDFSIRLSPSEHCGYGWFTASQQLKELLTPASFHAKDLLKQYDNSQTGESYVTTT
jgi:8-oxo-dGTP pyrophosphatase MutT (NUDIX family)